MWTVSKKKQWRYSEKIKRSNCVFLKVNILVSCLQCLPHRLGFSLFLPASLSIYIFVCNIWTTFCTYYKKRCEKSCSIYFSQLDSYFRQMYGEDMSSKVYQTSQYCPVANNSCSQMANINPSIAASVYILELNSSTVQKFLHLITLGRQAQQRIHSSQSIHSFSKHYGIRELAI